MLLMLHVDICPGLPHQRETSPLETILLMLIGPDMPRLYLSILVAVGVLTVTAATMGVDGDADESDGDAEDDVQDQLVMGRCGEGKTTYLKNF